MAAGVAISPPLPLAFRNDMRNGKHLGGFKYRNRRNLGSLGRRSVWGAVVTTIAGTLIKDFTSENSKIIHFFKKIVKPQQIEDNQKKVIDADYSVVSDSLQQKEPDQLEKN